MISWIGEDRNVPAPKKTLVLGVGNLLMGDEGVGIRVVRRLEERLSDPGTEIVDGGTGGLHLLEYFLDRDRVILVDAVMDGSAPGTVSVSKPVYARDYPRTLVAHDIGLKDVLDAVALLDRRSRDLARDRRRRRTPRLRRSTCRPPSRRPSNPPSSGSSRS